MKETEWISVRDKYPPRWKYVWVKNYQNKFLAYRTIGNNWRYQSGFKQWMGFDDHWMPLQKKDRES